MAAIPGKLVRSQGNTYVVWSEIGSGDTPSGVEIGSRAPKSVQILGAHGASNTVTLQGSMDDTTYAGLNDLQDSAISQAETGTARIVEVTPVADVSGSLNNTYFYISSTGTDYYGWFNVDAGGTDPAISGRTAVAIAISEDDNVATICDAIVTAFDALDSFSVADGTTKTTFTYAAKGEEKTADSDAGSSGVTFNETTPGVWGTRPVTAIQEHPRYIKPVLSTTTVDTYLNVYVTLGPGV